MPTGVYVHKPMNEEVRRHHSEGAKKSIKLRDHLVRLNGDPNHKRKSVEALLNFVHSPEGIAQNHSPKHIAQLRGLAKDPDLVRHRAETLKNNTTHHEQVLSVWIPAMLKSRPMTTAERVVATTLSPFWRYVGNGVFPIKTAVTVRFPDFVNEETHELIEVFGDYWHRGQDPASLIAEYAIAGWKCVVVWEHRRRRSVR